MSLFHTLSVDDTLRKLKTSLKGLFHNEVKERLKAYGYNVLRKEEIKKWQILLRQFNNPLVFILIGAAVLTAVMGHAKDSLIIVFIILFNGILGFWQEIKAISSMEALQKLAEERTVVLRDGKEIEIPVSHVVPGDIVILGEGDVVPADIRLIKSTGLLVDEAILTGESVPVEKNADVVHEEDTPIYKRENVAFKGTVVVRGKALGAVFATGKNTEIGKIAERAKESSPESPLTRALQIFSKRWMVVLFSILAVILVVALLEKRDIYDVIMLIIAELVSAVPEGLPLVITFVLVMGAVFLSKKKVLVKYLPAVETLGSSTYIISDKTGTITEGKLKVYSTFAVDKEELYNVAALCNDSDGEKGDPLEIALLRWLEKESINWRLLRQKAVKLWEYPFDTKKRLMAVAVEVDGKRQILVKGAFESLSEFSLKDEAVKKLSGLHDELASQGLRVLAFGVADVSGDDFSIDSLTLKIVGLVGFIDPPKDGVKEAVNVARKAGIRVVMVTGDNPSTAAAIARSVDILKEKEQVLKGTDIDKMTDEELFKVLKKTAVVARATPDNKYRIVRVLQAAKEVVAVTGDGVNDVPALKAADLGIAMGGGSQAAREVAKMVITDNNLSIIVDAVKTGREIAKNIRKAIYYLLSCSFGEIFVVTSGFFLNLPLPLQPVQILWINLVTEGVQDKTFAFGKSDKDPMEDKPKKPEEAFFDRKQLKDTAFAAVLMGILVVGIFVYLLGHSNYEKANTVAFTSLVVIQWFNGIQSIKEKPFFLNVVETFKVNPYMFLAIFVGFVLQLIAVYLIPGILNTVPLTLLDWGYIFASGIVFFLLIEVKKWFST